MLKAKWLHTVILPMVLLIALLAKVGLAEKPAVWVLSDMTDKRLPGPGASGTITDPDDISAMAGFLLFANEFVIHGITISSTSRKQILSAPDQAAWANSYIGAAYRQDVASLNAHLGGYPEDIVFKQASSGGQRFNEERDYADLKDYPTVQALVDQLNTQSEPLYILGWGATTEAAIAVKHCISTQKQESLSRIRILTHWTTSYLHNAGKNHHNVANCNFDRPACMYLKEQAAKGVIKYYECGAIGQYGIVSGGPRGDDYFNRFKKSALGNIFMEGKYAHGNVDWSDAATYVVLMGKYGVTLNDLKSDATTSVDLEAQLENTFKNQSKVLHDELLRRVEAAAKPLSQ